ncbi:MAG: BTAD domain-containing putative transcriptional regulator [Microbacteriaceae bacterium]
MIISGELHVIVNSGAAQLTALSPSAPTHAEGVVVTVERGDSPWGLAERHLGDGVRWRELFALNRGVLQPDGRAWTDPQTILVGWRLRLPPDEAVASRPSGRSTTTLVHIVEPGDTLTGLAARYLGDPARYREVFDANLDVIQPDGRRLRDPSVIVVGWQLTIPIASAEPTTSHSPSPSDPVSEPPAAHPPIAVPPSAPETTAPTVEPATTSPPAGESAGAADTAPPSDPIPPHSGPPPSVGAAGPRDVNPDGHSSAPVAVGIGLGVVLATGLAVRLRSLRRRRARRGPRHDAAPRADAEASLTAGDEPLVRWAGQQLAIMARGLHRRRLTAAPLAVELSDETGLEILWDEPQHALPPSGWVATDGGWAWRRPYDPDDAVPVDELAAVIPALVTIGQRDGRQLLVDVEAFGTLTVDGPAVHVDEFARSVALELACGGDLADAYVTLVGVDLDSAIAPVHRLTVADVPTAAAQLARTTRSVAELLAAGDTVDTFRARGGDRPPIEATIVVASHLNPADVDTLASAIRARHGVGVVACGARPRAGGAHIEIRADGASATLYPLALAFQPVGVVGATADAIAATARSLATTPAGDQAAGWVSVAGWDGEGRPVPAVAAVLAPPVAPHDGAAVGQNASAFDAEESTDNDGPGRGSDAARPEKAVAGDVGPEMVVRVLGVPRIDERPDIGRRELILAVLLACRGGALAATAAQDALWGGKPVEAKTVWNFVAKARRALGEFEDGTTVMPPADRLRGALRLDQRVITDLELLRRAVTDADNCSSAEAIRILRDALRLVEGPPFDAAGYDWAHRDQHVADAAAVIARAVDALVRLAIDGGQTDIAREAVTRGLRGLPGDEHLYRTRMRVEAAVGNHAGVVAAYDELCVYLADLDTQPSATTTALHNELTRHAPGHAFRSQAARQTR